MVLPRWYAALVSLPIITIGTVLFVIYQRRHPINDRPRWLSIATGVMLVLYDILTLTAGDSDANGAPCPPALIAINVAIIPLFVLTFLFRGMVLLWKYEITADIINNNKNNGNNGGYMTESDGNGSDEWMAPSSPTATSHHHQHHHVIDSAVMTSMPAIASANRLSLSWYTKNFHMMKPVFLGRIVAIQLTIGIAALITISIGQGSIPCTQVSVWWTLQFIIGTGFSAVIAIALLVVVKLLWRHHRDGMGIKFELFSCVAAILAYCLIGLPIIVYGLEAYDVEKATTQSLGNILGVITVWYPLWLSYQHIRKQRAIAQQVQHVHTLAQLLAIPSALTAFATFLSENFASENLSCWLRVRELKSTITIPTSTALVPSSPTAINHGGTISPFSPRHQSSPVVGNRPLTLDTKSPVLSGVALVTCLSTTLKNAYSIYRSFIVAGSPFEVNISSTTRQQITLQLQSMTTAVASAIRSSHLKRGATATSALPSSPHHTTATNNNAHNNDDGANILLLQSLQCVYDDAVRELEQLMTTNYLLRFRMSKIYQSLLDELNQQAGAVVSMVAPRSPILGNGAASRMSRVSQQQQSPKAGGGGGTPMMSGRVSAAAAGHGDQSRSNHSTPSLNGTLAAVHVHPSLPPLTISPKLMPSSPPYGAAGATSSPAALTSPVTSYAPVMAWSPCASSSTTRYLTSATTSAGAPTTTLPFPSSSMVLSTQSSSSPGVSQTGPTPPVRSNAYVVMAPSSPVVPIVTSNR